ncbi:hypothetical protein DPMN_053505 [Dreissena polymorpha]|uniref:Uncharacterized protein n=1 Tax=Dreissena polymorpha TaxID=45954 RepID=A0A9D4CNW8_DREPO|nr:hypothetical protein DPMN_053505 [Dreissena polymorpha]
MTFALKTKLVLTKIDVIYLHEPGALPISGDTYRKCKDICMLSCHDGYTLSTTTDETGCQTCACVDSEPCRIIT